MFIFGNDQNIRGCWTSWSIDSAFSKGAYLQLPDGMELRQTMYDPYIVTGLSFAQKEKYHLVQCFADTVHTYAFGHDPTSSIVSVDFTGFMIGRENDGNRPSDLFTDMFRAYSQNRISKKPEYAYVYMGQKLLGGFLIGMQSSTMDVMHNLQSFKLDLLAVEVHT